jgi:hypothetical protein
MSLNKVEGCVAKRAHSQGKTSLQGFREDLIKERALKYGLKG